MIGVLPGVLSEGIRVFGSLDKSYYLDVALITVLTIPTIVVVRIIFHTLFWAKGKLYKYLIVVGAIFLFISWPVGTITICFGLFFRYQAISQVKKNIQENFKPIVKLKPNGETEYVDKNSKYSGWAFDGEYYINRSSSIKFPQQFGNALNLTSLLIYDDLGENCSIGYQSIILNCYATAYIYKKHSNDLLFDTFKTELENIAISHPDLSIPSSQEFWGVDAETVGNNLNFPESSFISSALCYEERAIKVKSFIILTQFAGNYIKIRATWPGDTSFQSRMVLSTLREVLTDLTVFNRLDMFGIEHTIKPTRLHTTLKGIILFLVLIIVLANSWWLALLIAVIFGINYFPRFLHWIGKGSAHSDTPSQITSVIDINKD